MAMEELREECGVFGIYAPDRHVSYLAFDGLFALQHRGQESAGMAVTDGQELTVLRDMGLVTQVFDERKLASLQGHMAIGHTRYSTTGSSEWRNAQPCFRHSEIGGFALAHNGNITNTAALAEEAGVLPGTITSDSELVAELVIQEMTRACRNDEDASAALVAALETVMPRVEGAYSMVIMDTDRLIAIRDPHGFHPLCLGRLDDAGWVLASETPALHTVGAQFIREIEPGEMVVIEDGTPVSMRPFPPEQIDPRLCFFEFVYFARPDSYLYGKQNFTVRYRLGELLAKAAPPPTDSDLPTIVIGVPDSGLPAAEGYATAAHLPLSQGLVKNRYIGRTFISPDPANRAQAVRRKLSPLTENVKGKRLIVVDDTIVRGTTPRAVVSMLREAGAAEIHLRISAPPYRWPCFYGIDVGTRAELLAANLDLDEMRAFLGVDSLAYLSMDDVRAAIAVPNAGLCDACVTGDYPVPIPKVLNKHVLDPKVNRPADGSRDLQDKQDDQPLQLPIT